MQFVLVIWRDNSFNSNSGGNSFLISLIFIIYRRARSENLNSQSNSQFHSPDGAFISPIFTQSLFPQVEQSPPSSLVLERDSIQANPSLQILIHTFFNKMYIFRFNLKNNIEKSKNPISYPNYTRFEERGWNRRFFLHGNEVYGLV